MKTKTRRKTLRVLSVAACSLALSLSTSAQEHKPAIITFDYPGTSGSTTPQAISPAGAVTGFYVDENDVFHGFVRSPEGAFATFDAPGAGSGAGTYQGTFPTSVSPKGEIVGTYTDSNYAAHGFLRASDGTITTYDAPGAVGNTQGSNINPAGEIAGWYADANNVNHGYVRTADGTFTSFDAPDAGTGSGQGTFTATVDGLNPTGWISGYTTDANGLSHGYVRSPGGAFSTFDAPGAGTGSGQGTDTSGVNPVGTVTGYYIDANGVYHSYVRGPRGEIATLDVAGAGTASGQGTLAECINQIGQIPGYYVDANNVYHGFVRAPDGGITTFDVPGAGTSAYQGTVAYSNDSAGAVTGYYFDTNGVHGFLLIP